MTLLTCQWMAAALGSFPGLWWTVLIMFKKKGVQLDEEPI